MTTDEPITQARNLLIQILQNHKMVTDSQAKVLTISTTFDDQLATACAAAPYIAVCPIFSLYTPVNNDMAYTAVGYVDFDVNIIALEDVAEVEGLAMAQSLYKLNDTGSTTADGQQAVFIVNTPISTLSNYPYLVYSLIIRVALP